MDIRRTRDREHDGGTRKRPKHTSPSVTHQTPNPDRQAPRRRESGPFKARRIPPWSWQEQGCVPPQQGRKPYSSTASNVEPIGRVTTHKYFTDPGGDVSPRFHPLSHPLSLPYSDVIVVRSEVPLKKNL